MTLMDWRTGLKQTQQVSKEINIKFSVQARKTTCANT